MSLPRTGPHEPGCYEVCLEGRLDEQWSSWFDGMTLSTSPEPTGTGVRTILRGRVADQAALHGLLTRLRDIGLPLVSISRIEACTPTRADLPPEGADR